MPRWLPWTIPAVLVIGGVIAVLAIRAARDGDPEVPDDTVDEELTDEEATPSRVETEDQMRAIGYVQ